MVISQRISEVRISPHLASVGFGIGRVAENPSQDSPCDTREGMATRIIRSSSALGSGRMAIILILRNSTTICSHEVTEIKNAIFACRFV